MNKNLIVLNKKKASKYPRTYIKTIQSYINKYQKEIDKNIDVDFNKAVVDKLQKMINEIKLSLKSS